MAETKPKPASSLREPKPKKKLGLAVPPPLRMPHDDLIQSEKAQAAETSAPKTVTPAESTGVVSTGVDFTPNKIKDKDNLKRGEFACARCKDTGFWYPEGVAKGVKRCDHIL